MIRETTLEAYNEIRENGLLTKLKWAVYECLFKHGPMTANEMRLKMGGSANSGVYSTRLSELERMGVVRTLEKRPCATTGKNAFVWQVTRNLPVDLKKQKKVKCDHCNGKGYHLADAQQELF